MPVIRVSAFGDALVAPSRLGASFVATVFEAGKKRAIRIDGMEVTFPLQVTAAIAATGVTELTLEAVPVGYWWHIAVTYADSDRTHELVRDVVFPAGPGPFTFEELVDIDTSTVEPLVPLPPSAQEVLEQAAAARDDAVAAAGDAVGSADFAGDAADDAEGFANLAEAAAAQAQVDMLSREPAGLSNATKTALSNTYGTLAADLVETQKAALTQIDPRVMRPLRDALAGAATAPCVIVAAGDSLTKGDYATPGFSWLELINKRLSAAYPRRPFAVNPVLTFASAPASPPAAPGVTVINAGTNGAQAGSYLNTTTDLVKIAAMKPAAVIHSVGFNDWNHLVPIANFKAYVKQRIDGIKALLTAPCVQIVVFNYEYPGETDFSIQWYEYGVALAQLAAEDPTNVVFLDNSGPFYAAGVKTGDPYDLILPDGTHPNDKGNDLMARLTFNALTVPKVVQHRDPTLFMSDTFARPDGPLVGAPEVGGAPYVFASSAAGTVRTVGGLLRISKAAGAESPFALTATGQVNGRVGVKFVGSSGNLIFRGDSATNYLLLTSGAVGTPYTIYKLAASIFTLLATLTAVRGVGDSVSVELSGSTITAVINGVRQTPLVDSTHITNLSQGVSVGGAGASVVDFRDLYHVAL